MTLAELFAEYNCEDLVGTPMFREIEARIVKLEAENAQLREALNHAPHDSKCASHKQEHIPGLIHYETDRELPCPWYHFRRGKCNCWKSRAASAPKAEYETETAI